MRLVEGGVAAAVEEGMSRVEVNGSDVEEGALRLALRAGLSIRFTLERRHRRERANDENKKEAWSKGAEQATLSVQVCLRCASSSLKKVG